MNRRCFDLFNKVSYSGYKKEEIADLFKSSKAVLDITHPNQKALKSDPQNALLIKNDLVWHLKKVSLIL
jgi:hypothetical protein